MSQPEQFNPDALLDALLHKLPDKPLASNFTARVLDQVERESRTTSQPFWQRLHWLPKLAFASLALLASVSSYEIRTHAERTKFTRSLTAVAEVSSLPSADMLKDFDTIRRLNQNPPADTELLALLR